jgi:hypothetical protein
VFYEKMGRPKNNLEESFCIFMKFYEEVEKLFFLRASIMGAHNPKAAMDMLDNFDILKELEKDTKINPKEILKGWENLGLKIRPATFQVKKKEDNYLF